MARFKEWPMVTYVDVDELDALREAVEVLENAYEPTAHVDYWYQETLKMDDAYAAAREAVEVLENIPHAADAELRYYRNELNLTRDYLVDTIEEANAAAEAVEVLEDMHDADLAVNAKLQRRNDNQYAIITERDKAIDRLRARIKTYRAALGEMVKAGPMGVCYYFANHILNSRIEDGGSDF